MREEEEVGEGGQRAGRNVMKEEEGEEQKGVRIRSRKRTKGGRGISFDCCIDPTSTAWIATTCMQ